MPRIAFSKPTPETLSFWALLALWAGLTFSNALIEIAFVAALIFWFISFLKDRRHPFAATDRRIPVSLALFSGIVILSHFWSESKDESFRGIFKILQFVVVLIMTANLRRDQLGVFEKFFLAIAVLVVANGFWQYFTGTDFIRGLGYTDATAGKRISASFKTYSQLGSFLILTLPFLAVLGNSSPGFSWRRAGLLFLAFGGLIILYFTRSRGAILAFAAGLILIICLKRKFGLLALLIASMGIGLLFIPKSMIIHSDVENKEQSLVERYYLWDRAIQVIQAKPLTGTGINTYLATHAKYDETDSPRVVDYYAHNSYLQLGAEIGLPGLASFLFFLIFTWLWGWEQAHRTPVPYRRQLYLGIWLGLFNFMLFATVDTGFDSTQSAMAFWYFLGILLAYLRTDPDIHPEQHSS